MDSYKDFLTLLKLGGHRLTKARKAIIKMFLDMEAPLSVAEIKILLAKININVNKTTIYREIHFLKSQNIIRELRFGDGKRRFEIRPDNHHHHLVCVSCDSIECFELERCLKEEEKNIFRQNRFRTIKHSLEFQGLCAKCQ